jgi:uncharacterized damage-inducible protein DinB
MTYLSKLVQHCIWANSTWVALLARETTSDEYLARMMSHILLGEQAWFQRIMRQEPDVDVWWVMPLDQMQQLHEQHAHQYHAFLEGDLHQIVEYRRFTGEEYRSSVSDILLHLCTHGAHHRGQMATYASRNGLRATNTDFINFCIVNGL